MWQLSKAKLRAQDVQLHVEHLQEEIDSILSTYSIDELHSAVPLPVAKGAQQRKASVNPDKQNRGKASRNLLALWAQCTQLDDELEHLSTELPDPIEITRDADLEAVENIRQVLSSIVVHTVAMVRGLAPLVKTSRLVRCHVPSMRPREVKTSETVLPSVATIWLKMLPMRICCIVVLLIAQTASLLVLASVVEHWAFVWISVLGLPTVFFVFTCLSKSIMRQLMYTFQSLYIFGASMFFVSTLFYLLKAQPQKLVALMPYTLSLLVATALDAYPEVGRKPTQRFYYIIMLVSLITLQMTIVLNLIGIEDTDAMIQPVSWSTWTFKISDLTSAALSSLMPFAFRNLMASFRNGDSLVAVKADVVSVRLDLCCLVILETAHSLLALEASEQNRTMKKVLTARRGSIEGLSKRASKFNHRSSRSSSLMNRSSSLTNLLQQPSPSRVLSIVPTSMPVSPAMFDELLDKQKVPSESEPSLTPSPATLRLGFDVP